MIRPASPTLPSAPGRKRQRDDRESAAEAAATEALDHEAVFNAFGVHGVTRGQVGWGAAGIEADGGGMTAVPHAMR
eukprot:8897874-Pyramimonas_sp.AAC.1